MELWSNAINWFEIPVSDFDRAVKFYSAIFDYEMPVNPMGPNMMGFFLHEQGKGIGGSIVSGPGYEPSSSGSKVYLNGGNDLSMVLDRVADNGGSVIVAKTEISPDIGFFAIFEDTEGNHVALHSMA